MSYNPDILAELLESRSLNRQSLSKRLGIEKDQLQRELSETPEPKQKILRSIAKELAVPIFAFYMKEAPTTDDSILDFRSEKPRVSPKSRETLEAIQLARSIQRKAGEVAPSTDVSLLLIQEPRVANISRDAARVREFLGISLRDQLDAKDTREFYALCRRKIEASHIFVIQESFPKEDGSGFCLASETHPVLVINTKEQTRGRRLFTLIHELAHALIGLTGISDPFTSNNALERYCNRFASEFLTPRDGIDTLLGGITVPKKPSYDDIRAIARKLKLSQQATILRLEQLGRVAVGSYQIWISEVAKFGNPDFGKEGGGAGGPPPQEKVKLARYGFYFAELFGTALDLGTLNDLQLYRASGLKPKYQRQYISFARSLKDSDLQEVEFGDD